MTITTGQTGEASDFINQSEKDGTPANDAGRVPKLESDGRLSGFFTRNGAIVNCGETLSGATTPVPVYQNKTDNELYACDANDPTKYKYIGFVTSDGTNGNPANFQGQGIVSGFTGLDEGEKYYVQDTAGTIGTTPGTMEILVGVAISPTQILIMRGKRRDGGNVGSLGTASGSSVITCGFRPSVIRLFAGLADDTSTTTISYMNAVWINGVMKAAVSLEGNGTGSSIDNSAIIIDGSATMTFTITSVTDTGFTITWTESGNFGSSTLSRLSWEAEGEL
jgi:hypothetical protein